MRDRSPSMWRRLDKLMDHVEDKKEDTETWTKLQVLWSVHCFTDDTC